MAEGRADRVFERPDRAPAAVATPIPEVFVVKTASAPETGELLDRLQREDPAATVFVAPPRAALARTSGASATATAAPMDHWGMAAIGPHLGGVDASTVTVAVVDTGVDRHHPDLAGAIDDYVNFCTHETDQALNGHGTHVCGIIAGTGHPPWAMRGVCNARLVVFKGLAEIHEATGYYRALRAAATRAKILNLSLGGIDRDPVEELILEAALQDGVLVVAASGNDDDGTYPYYPAALPGVLAVGAVDSRSARAPFSNRGPHVALVAPGVQIWSTVPTYQSLLFKTATGYAPLDGTSMAAPFVGGMAARVAARLGTPDAGQIRDGIAHPAVSRPVHAHR